MNTNVAAKFVSSCMRRFDPKGLYSEEWLLEEPVQALMLLQNWGMFYFGDGKMPKWLDRCIELCARMADQIEGGYTGSLPITIIYGDKDDATAWSFEIDKTEFYAMSEHYVNEGGSIRGTMREVLDYLAEDI